MLTLFPLSFPPCVVDLFGRGEWGLCRGELSEDMNTNGNTSHIGIEPPIQKRIPFVAEPYLSSAIVLSGVCYSLRLWTFATALGNCRNMMLFHPLVSSAPYRLVPVFPSDLSCRWVVSCGPADSGVW